MTGDEDGCLGGSEVVIEEEDDDDDVGGKGSHLFNMVANSSKAL